MDREPCVFGDGPRNSGEHIFPNWMNKELGRQPTFDVLTRAEDGSERTYRKRLVAHIKYPVVCGDCNSGWMSVIEGDTKEMIVALMHGYDGSWSAGDQLQLATWATLKMIVIDARKPERHLVSRENANLFREQHRPFADAQITVAGHHHGGQFSIQVKQVIGMRGRDEHWSAAYATTMVMAHLAILVVGFPGSNDGTLQSLGLADDRTRTVMPPVLAGMAWPPPCLVDDSFLDQLADEGLRITGMTSEKGPPPSWPSEDGEFAMGRPQRSDD